MTKENCIKYRDEAKNDKTKKFWADRIERKYPEKIVIKEVKPKSRSKK